ncbi:MAG: O-antigen ligase family protein [Terriglobales bacterium]
MRFVDWRNRQLQRATTGLVVGPAMQEHGDRRSSLAYHALVVFSFLYYTRPQDVIPGLADLPVEKIVGGIVLVALIAGLATRRLKARVPLEIKLLLLLFADLCVTIPFAFWKGGSFSVVFEQFSKAVLVALLVAMVVQNVGQLRRLLWVQAAAVATMTCLSIALHPGGVRLQGVLGGIFENPNDLAVDIAINWPLGVAFLLAARGLVRKTFWVIGLLGMVYGLIATFSRSGFIAMSVAMLACFWEYGIRGKRVALVGLTGILVVGTVAVAVSTPHYLSRLHSIVQGGSADAEDEASWEARRELLVSSVELALRHPVFGVGPGNFPAVTESWHVTHNTYTEFAAEAGFPALILFVTILALAFRNLRRVRKTETYARNEEVRLFTGALWASLAAYLVGALFSSTEYNLFPYFMVGYTSALSALSLPAAEARPEVDSYTLAARFRSSMKLTAPNR